MQHAAGWEYDPLSRFPWYGPEEYRDRLSQHNPGKNPHVQSLLSLGTPPWTRSDIVAGLDEFEAVYAQRPIRDNQGGMKAPHMFAVWFMAKRLSPDLIVESGVLRGQSTWLLEQACPAAKLIAIDLDLSARQYVSDRAVYSSLDFSEQDWSEVTDRSLVFFDDHQNAYKRLQQCRWFGFKHVLFEDNYPVTQGDCYSLKKAFSQAGFEPAHSAPRPSTESGMSRLMKKAGHLLGIDPISLTPQYESAKIRPNAHDQSMLKKNLAVYYEFPPVFQVDKTRWGDAWDPVVYPTPEPLLDPSHAAAHPVFWEEAVYYTWLCYVQLK